MTNFRDSVSDYNIGDDLMNIHDGIGALKNHHQVLDHIVMECDAMKHIRLFCNGMALPANKMLCVVSEDPRGGLIAVATYDTDRLHIVRFTDKSAS